MKNPQFEFQPLTESDLPLMVDWLNRPHLQKWWRSGEITLDRVREKYLPRIFDEDAAKPYLAFLDENPVGYIQYYSVSEGVSDWWPDTPDEGVLGIDVFIGNENQLDNGIGTVMISQFVELLMRDPAINEIRVDPRPDNLRAIRCYEKVGFQNKGRITNPDGPALMMVLKR